MHDTKLTSRERRYIQYCERFYFLENGGFPTNEQAAVALGYTVTDINYFLQNQKVVNALEKRGLPFDQITHHNQLTPTQVAVAITMSNFADTRPDREKLAELGVNPQQYYGWLNNKLFQQYMNSLADRNMQSIRPDAFKSFHKLVRDGDWKAIQYYFEVTGQFQSQEVKNIQVIIQRLIESVQRHVRDPEVLASISRDILGVAPNAASHVQIEASPTSQTAEEFLNSGNHNNA